VPPFHPHPWLLMTWLVLGSLHVRVSRGRRGRALAGWGALALVTLWPVGDVAASQSLTVATAQRLVVMLFVAPMLLMATSTVQLSRWSRPGGVDAVTKWLARPVASLVVVTVVGTATLSTPVVDAGARSTLARAAVMAIVLACGLVLWVPALGVMPGARRLSPIGRAAFVFVASLLVTSLSFVWIFAHHSLYPGLHDQSRLWHLTPLLDQQIAGFVAKLGSYVPMWAVAFTIFSRADESGVSVEESPLHWADVERELERIDRRRARASRRGASEARDEGE